MNSLTQYLIKDLLPESFTPETIGVLGGGFKPPTRGHFNLIKRIIKENPDLEELIVYVGGGVRNDLTQEDSLNIWEIYRKYLSPIVKFEPSKAPIGDIYRLSKNNPASKILFFLGAREGKEDDLEDIKYRTKAIGDKYPNLEAKTIITPYGGMSGTNARKSISQGIEEFSKFLPEELSPDEIKQVYDIVASNIKEEISPDVLDSFELKDHLVEEIWEGDKLKTEVREKLLQIAQDFFESLGLPNYVTIEDITLTGSLANYNWSKFSDVDLHIRLDFSKIDGDIEFLKKYFLAMKSIWNNKHNIDMFGFPVEVYVEDINENHTASGLYSILNDEWINVPSKTDLSIDEEGINLKTEDYFYQLSKLEELFNKGKYHRVVDNIEEIKEKLRNMRSAGLEQGGEYSIENLTFKVLRRSGYIETLNDLKTLSYDRMMSLEEIQTPAKEEDVDPKELKMGIDVEMEHTKDKKKSKIIALQHLAEDPKYYTKLKSLNLQENLNYSEHIDYKEKIKDITKFYLKKYPQIKELPKVIFKNKDEENAKDFLGKTAYYDPNTKTIVLYTEGRHPKDLVRSYSHEFIHFIQDIEGRLGDIQTTNTLEDDELQTIEQEAYLKGNINFRNWTDSLQENLKEGKQVGTLYHYTDFDHPVKYLNLRNKELSQEELSKFLSLFNIENTTIESKNKDPFGLNQYARELAQGLEEAIVDSKLYPFKVTDRTYDEEDNSLITTEYKFTTPNNTYRVEFYSGEYNPESKTFDLSFGVDKGELNTIDTFQMTGEGNARKIFKTILDIVEDFINKEDVEKIVVDGTDEKRKRIYKILFSSSPSKISDKIELKEAIVGDKIECDNCGWSWDIEDGGDDLYTCHKCWHDNTPKQLNEGRYDTLTNKLSSIAFETFKDPFGLNQYVRELAQSIDEQVLREGKYTKLITQLTNFIFTNWKKQVEKGTSLALIKTKVTPKKYATSLTFDLEASLYLSDKQEFLADGEAYPYGDTEEGLKVGLDFIVPEDSFPQIWEKISYNISDILRHEIEHMTQVGVHAIPSKEDEIEDDDLIRNLIDIGALKQVRYYTLPSEIDPMLQGIYTAAKKSKTPFKQAVDSYLDLIPKATKKDKNYIRKVWSDRIPALSLPSID